MRTVGSVLREARAACGLTIADLEKRTKIKAKYLEALEEDRFSDLPGPVYARGFLRLVAREVNLNPDEVVALYEQATREQPAATPVTVAPSPEPPAQSEAPVERDGERASKRLWVLAGALLGIIIVAWLLASGRSPREEEPFRPEPQVTDELAAPPAELEPSIEPALPEEQLEQEPEPAVEPAPAPQAPSSVARPPETNRNSVSPRNAPRQQAPAETRQSETTPAAPAPVPQPEPAPATEPAPAPAPNETAGGAAEQPQQPQPGDTEPTPPPVQPDLPQLAPGSGDEAEAEPAPPLAPTGDEPGVTVDGTEVFYPGRPRDRSE